MDESVYHEILVLVGRMHTNRPKKSNQRRDAYRKIINLIWDAIYIPRKGRLQRRLEGLVSMGSKAHRYRESLRPTFANFSSNWPASTQEAFVNHVLTGAITSEEPLVVLPNLASEFIYQSLDACAHKELEHEGIYGFNEHYSHCLSDYDARTARLADLISTELATATAPETIEEEETMTNTHADAIQLDDAHKTAVDALFGLSGKKGLSVDGINAIMKSMHEKAEESANKLKQVLAQSTMVAKPTAVAASGEIPACTVAGMAASEVFNVTGNTKNTLFSFNIPVFEWDGVHPDVPEVDEHYQFNLQALYRVLQGIVDNDNSYLFGHTGTGKSTLVEQVCARMNYPLVRVNFDSEISRMDLVGRDTLIEENGQTVSKFVDGVLPDALSRPCMLLCDEVDFIRPDVMYVFQRVLEGNGLLVSEDGGRRIHPDPWFRLVATANTCGQGDDSGMYMGARPQSMATLDRFANWIKVDYMKTAQEVAWLKKVNASLDKTEAKVFVEYAKEHREAFTSGKVLQPLSPRGLKALARRYTVTNMLTNDEKESMKEAFGSAILDRCSEQDRVVLFGLVQRVIGA